LHTVSQTEPMHDDVKRIVETGYDSIVDRFAEWQRGVRGSARMRYLDEIVRRLPPDADVLELGCGAGVRSTRILAERGRLTGVDISAEQIRRARERVPGARFIQSDMTKLELEAESLDAVVALFTLAHVPHAELPGLMGRVATWLRPGGRFLATMGSRGAGESIEDDWLGVPMFFSSLDAEESRRLVRDAGLEIELDEVVTQSEPGYGEIEFLWLLARRPDGHG
jgi:SAM-dependent methyltransferase